MEEPTIILEVVASTDLWIWHAIFGCLGLIMISMCFTGLLYSLSWQRAGLLR
jgi:hypothetical protein